MGLLDFNNQQFGRQNVFATTDGTLPTQNTNGLYQLGDMIVNLAGTVGQPAWYICTNTSTPTFSPVGIVGGGSSVRSTATATTLLATDSFLFLTAAAALTLPAPSSTLGTHAYSIKASAGPVTITPASGNLDGSTSAVTLQAQQSLIVFTDASNWFTYGKGVGQQIRTISSNGTLSVTDKYVLSGAGTTTIPAPAGFSIGYAFTIKATASSVTITPASGTIDGATSVTLTANQLRNIITDGSNFFVVGS